MGTNGSATLEPLWRGLPPVDPSTTLPDLSDSASCALPARFEAVRGARHFAGATLERWELPELFDDVALVVSELVTNALRHALPVGRPERAAGDGPLGPADSHEAHVRLHLMRWASRLVCAVRDPSEESPTAGEAGSGEESGRGLHLVESYSDGWGWHPLAGSLHGKIVWALFLLPRQTGRG
ncbi:ATP-binding protein [Streptomyces sp. LX-29]|uniref:ATP-binding protein n=1 Tax=Streptomyces sp. LX-29 TaxID=2900152 RepID=UPI00240DA2EB|nr:ATP-binding protein [Streptomyces sp. LX-29]WFB08166.1 ATP-binding protein [Streptomyces sp. LX-29]